MSPAVSTKEMGWYSSNILDPYSGGAWFESPYRQMLAYYLKLGQETSFQTHSNSSDIIISPATNNTVK
jgi:hypothetical protein